MKIITTPIRNIIICISLSIRHSSSLLQNIPFEVSRICIKVAITATFDTVINEIINTPVNEYKYENPLPPDDPSLKSKKHHVPGKCFTFFPTPKIGRLETAIENVNILINIYKAFLFVANPV